MPLRASGGLLATLGVPWLICASLQLLPLSSHGILVCVCVCVCVSVFSSCKDTNHWIKAHPNPI